MQNVKLVLVGDGAVGKTCLLMSYAEKTFPVEYVPTVFDNRSVSVVVDGTPVNLGLWDTAGQEEYERVRPLSYPMTDVFLVCFAVTSPESFENISSKWIPEIKQHVPTAPLVLVGTKADLRNDSKSPCVGVQDANNLAKKIGAVQYVECSALLGTNLENVFNVAVRNALKAQAAAEADEPVGKPDKKCSIS